MYKKNDEIKLTITDLGSEGEGIGKIDGFPFFVKGAIPGDGILAGVTRVKKNYAFARLIRVLTPSGDRVPAPCPVFGRCGGCRLMHMSYTAQLSYKENKVVETLIRIGGLDREELYDKKDSIIGMEEPLRYRNKAVYPVARGRDGKLKVGFFAARTHEVIECDDCLIGVAENAKIIRIILDWMESCGIEAYDEQSRKGVIRHIFIRKGFVSGQLQLCLITAVRKIGQLDKLLELLGSVEGLRSIWLNINDENTNVIFGKTSQLLKGNEYIEDELLGIRFRISPLSFYQVNPLQTQKLYSKALEYADLQGGEYVWDVCCGIGTITLAAADRLRRLGKGGKVLGLEIVPEAIENAKENAALNGIENTEFVCAPAEVYLPERVKNAGERPDVIIVDPPRAGLEKAAIDAILSVSAPKLVYVSCDPATLARDLRLLADGGYTLQRFSVCDMFPQTSHVETVVQLSKGDIDRDSSERKSIAKTDDIGMISGYNKGNKAPETTNVKIDFSLENLDLSELRGKATYEQIKDYVREQTGFRVSTLYISQVKRKCGLEVGESYNKPKSEDAKQPQCTPEKEAAIIQALRHYGMI